jgi:hypothetical protein
VAKSWDHGLSLVQRQGILRVTLSVLLFMAGIGCVYGYLEVVMIQANLLVLAVGLSLLLATIFVSTSGLKLLLGIPPLSNKPISQAINPREDSRR